MGLFVAPCWHHRSARRPPNCYRLTGNDWSITNSPNFRTSALERNGRRPLMASLVDAVDHGPGEQRHPTQSPGRQSFRVQTALDEAEQSAPPRPRNVLGRGVKHHREVLGSVQRKRHVA